MTRPQRLRNTTEFAPAFQLAHAQLELGRIYTDAGHAERAIPLLTEQSAILKRITSLAWGSD